MKKIYITLERRVDSPEDSPEDIGEVVVIDWETKTVVKRLVADSEERVSVGRSRGAAGIDILGDILYVACRQQLVLFDLDSYEKIGTLSLAGPTGLHQVKSHDDYLYIICTGGNLFQRVKDQEWVNSTIVEGNGLLDTLHFNSIAWNPETGDQYHLYMKGNRIHNWTKRQDTVRPPGSLPHDLCFISGTEVLVSAANAGELHKLNLESGSDACVFSKPVKSSSYATKGFMRGIAFDKISNSVFVCNAPGTIFELDAETWQEKACLTFNDTPSGAVYDLVLDPRDWI